MGNSDPPLRSQERKGSQKGLPSEWKRRKKMHIEVTKKVKKKTRKRVFKKLAIEKAIENLRMDRIHCKIPNSLGLVLNASWLTSDQCERGVGGSYDWWGQTIDKILTAWKIFEWNWIDK